MQLTVFSNYLIHHQVWIADELYKLLGSQYTFVATLPPEPSLFKGGEDYSKKRSYCVRAYEAEGYRKAEDLAKLSEVCIFGADSISFAVIRAKNNPLGLSFEMGERWLKKGLLNLLSPRLIRWRWHYNVAFKKANFYYLCSSSFAAKDLSYMGAYRERCFKWGYFTRISDESKVEMPILSVTSSEITPLMWCARFLKWKHPELPVQLAARLKAKDYHFKIDMFGSGEELENTRRLIAQLGVEDCVKLCGNRPNEEILSEMRKHRIFLFTSDRNEGWGAVANEAMGNGCVLVGSDAIGSVPFLLKQRENGCVFKSGSIESLEEEVMWLIDNPEACSELSKAGQYTIRDEWSPQKASGNLIILIKDLLQGHQTSIKSGPCSVAPII